MLKTILYIAIGGAIGSVLRYLTSVLVSKYWANHFPLATFLTNILGCFLIGLLLGILEKNNLEMKDIDHLIFHPGGKKIVQTVEGLFSDLGKNISDTKEVLRLYGNMSSATVLYVLERIMDNQPKKGEKGLMLSFGPGFSAQRVLLQF